MITLLNVFIFPSELSCAPSSNQFGGEKKHPLKHHIEIKKLSKAVPQITKLERISKNKFKSARI